MLLSVQEQGEHVEEQIELAGESEDLIEALINFCIKIGSTIMEGGKIISKINLNQFMIDDESKHLVVPGEAIISEEDYMK